MTGFKRYSIEWLISVRTNARAGNQCIYMNMNSIHILKDVIMGTGCHRRHNHRPRDLAELDAKSFARFEKKSIPDCGASL